MAEQREANVAVQSTKSMEKAFKMSNEVPSNSKDADTNVEACWTKKRVSTSSPIFEGKREETNQSDELQKFWKGPYHMADANRKRNVKRRSSSAASSGKPAPPKTSVYRGVSYNRKNRKWKAVITYHGKQHFLGYFLNELSAARAYDKASHKRRGPTASLNFPSELTSAEDEGPSLHKTSRYRGVSFCKSNKKWKAVITYKGKQTYLGYFTSEIEAAKCYDRAARNNRGRSALTNFDNNVSELSSVSDRRPMSEAKCIKRKNSLSKSQQPTMKSETLDHAIAAYDEEEKTQEMRHEDSHMDVEDTRIRYNNLSFTDDSRHFGKTPPTKHTSGSVSPLLSFHNAFDHNDTDFLKIKDSFGKKLPAFDEEVKEEDKQFLSYLTKSVDDDVGYAPYEMSGLDSFLEFGL